MDRKPSVYLLPGPPHRFKLAPGHFLPKRKTVVGKMQRNQDYLSQNLTLMYSMYDVILIVGSFGLIFEATYQHPKPPLLAPPHSCITCKLMKQPVEQNACHMPGTGHMLSINKEDLDTKIFHLFCIN